MITRKDLLNPAKRAELRQQVFHLVHQDMPYREIARQLGLSSISTVSRLFHEELEARRQPLPVEIVREELAYLEAWQKRIEETFEIVLADREKIETIANLAKSAAQLTKARAELLSVSGAGLVDETSSASTTPWITEQIKEWEKSKIAQEDERDINGEGE